ncbi:hypothetical protein GCM10008967_13860 [Bacillus carboniphilus]|uniref:Membrane protein YkvI n=1 Tax=Bacillus carboniphilus TaxID=86663 RepID=A0ABN0W415_9BACI
MSGKWNKSIQLAAVYVGTIVGAGFATGKEIVEFFTRFGFIGLLGMILGGYLFISMGTKLMLVAIETGSKSYQELNIVLFGRIFGTGINVLMLFILLGVNAVMLSGAGAVFEEQLNIPREIGVFGTIFLAILVLAVGTKGLFAVNTFVVPMMVAFSFLLMFLSMRLPDFVEHVMWIPPQDDGWKSVLSPFTYTALNLSLAQAVLVPVASEINDKDIVKWGGRLGGLLLTLILLSSHFTLVMLDHVTLYEIPMAIMMKTLAGGLFWIFIIIIYGEIFTSVIGNTFGLERQIKQYLPIKSTWIISIIFIITYFISIVEYGTLLSILYPVFGYIGLAFLILLWMRPYDRIRKQ